MHANFFQIAWVPSLYVQLFYLIIAHRSSHRRPVNLSWTSCQKLYVVSTSSSPKIHSWTGIRFRTSCYGSLPGMATCQYPQSSNPNPCGLASKFSAWSFLAVSTSKGPQIWSLRIPSSMMACWLRMAKSSSVLLRRKPFGLHRVVSCTLSSARRASWPLHEQRKVSQIIIMFCSYIWINLSFLILFKCLSVYEWKYSKNSH